MKTIEVIQDLYEEIKRLNWTGLSTEYFIRRIEETEDCPWPLPKKKIIRYLWADKNGVISQMMRSEDEIKSYWGESPYIREGTIKLEWSKQEFDE